MHKSLRISEEAKALGATALILSENTLTAEEKFAIVEDCLENDIKVFNAPIISNYENEQSVSHKVKSLQIEDLLDRETILLNNCLL